MANCHSSTPVEKSKESREKARTFSSYETYCAALNRAVTYGRQLTFPLHWVKRLNGSASSAVVLAYLLHKMPGDRQTIQQNKMWFRCPANQIQKELGMGEEKVRSALLILQNQKLIGIERRSGNTLWVRLNPVSLRDI